MKIKLSDFKDIYNDSIRFCSHIFFLHMLSYLFNDEFELFGIKLIKTLIFTVISISIYHLIIRKIIYKR